MTAAGAAPRSPRSSLSALLRVAAATVLVVGSFALLGPVLAVRLQAAGASATAIGVYAMLPFASIALVLPWMPRLLHAVGVVRAYRWGLAIEAIATFGYLATDRYAAWCALAALGGVGAAAAWNATEALIAHNAPPERRGRVTGAYQTALGAALAAGPFVPGAFGLSASACTIAAALLLAAALVLTLHRGVSTLRASAEGAAPLGLATAMRRVPALVAIAFAGGVFEAGLSSITSAHGADIGLSLAAATSLAGAVGVGSVSAQYPFGWLADRVAPGPLVVASGALLAAASIAFGFAPAWPPLLWASACAWGAVGGALYTFAMIRVAHVFADSSAVAGTAAMISGYTVGAALGPTLSGLALDARGAGGQAVWLCVLALSVSAVGARLRDDRIERG